MRKLLLAVVVASGCATAGVAHSPGGNIIQVANLEQGGNCFPVRGFMREHGAVCTDRMHMKLEYLLGKLVDAHLARARGYQARLEVEGINFKTADSVAFRITERAATYRFTLTAPDGKPLLDFTERLTEPVSLINHGVSRPIPDEMLNTPELYRPGVLYQLVFDVLQRIGTRIDQAHLNPALASAH